MGETLTPRQLCNNSYHLVIRSSLLAIQTTLSLQQTMLKSDHDTITNIKSTIVAQNTTLQNTTRTLVEYFSKISTFQTPPPPTLGSAAPLQTSPPPENSSTANSTTPAPPTVPAAPNPQPPLPLFPALQTSLPATVAGSMTSASLTAPATTTAAATTFDVASLFGNATSTTTAATLLSAAPSLIPHPLQSPPPNNLKTWSLHVLQFDESCEKERKSAFGNARNLFDKIIKPTELSLELTKYETNNLPKLLPITYFSPTPLHSHTLCIIYQGVPGDYSEAVTSEANWKCKAYSISVGSKHKPRCEKKVLIFDPGGTFNIESIYDLEDKVDFKGSVMIRLNQMMQPNLGILQSHQPLGPRGLQSCI